MSAAPAGVPHPRWAALPPDALADWLGGRRWSGARGAPIGAVRVTAVVPFPLPDGAPCAVVIVDGTAAGAAVRWQLPLVAGGGAGEAVLTLDGVPVRDATLHAPFREALRVAVADGRELTGHDANGAAVTWRARRVGEDRRLDAALPSRVGSAEQSNTSMLYGDAAILKLFRRLEAGPQPDVEIGAALAAGGFAHVPALLGVIELDAPDGRTVLGMAQAMVPGARDAWEWVVERATQAVADGAAGAGWGESLAAARTLGEVTRALHDALAAVPDAEFAPEPATAADVRRWAEDARDAFDQALAAVEPGDGDGAAPPGFAEAREALASLAERRDALRAGLEALVDAVGDDAGQRIRHHGDYHLGQVLRASDGTLAVIDFEGEPARPLAARRARHSALRDVAGMLRSFGYAFATALRAGAVTDDRSARADRWEQAARDAFLAGYLGEPHGAGAGASYLPAHSAAVTALARIFELEKLFYELRYEVRNRPDWLPIPLRALRALLTDAQGSARAASAQERR